MLLLKEFEGNRRVINIDECIFTSLEFTQKSWQKKSEPSTLAVKKPFTSTALTAAIATDGSVYTWMH